MSPERAADARITELERWRARMEDRELPAKVDVLSEQVKTSRENLTDWQLRQDASLAEVHDTLKVLVKQTDESRGSLRTRKAIVAAAVIIITLLLAALGGVLQVLGVLG